MNDVIQSISEFNAGRDPERLELKFKAMRANAFSFLRATCHLFYQQLPDARVLRHAPITCVCGDLHLENFGSYKGDNRLVYFDVNDFDEAALAPCTWDLVRFLSSVLVGAESLHVPRGEAITLCDLFLESYAGALRRGKAQWIERDTAHGMIKELLDRLRNRMRPAWLDRRTDVKDKRRLIRLDGKRALAATDMQHHQIRQFMQAFADQQSNPKFFKVLDVARRVAGTGSLGVQRYVILVEGKGSPDGNYLLDLKEALPSAMMSQLTVKQPRWSTEAERIASVQQRMQAVSPAFLSPVKLARSSYLLRGLQPAEDRVDLRAWNGELNRLQGVIRVMGELTAWAQLRSGGRDGAAIADDVIEFGGQPKWTTRLRKVAEHCADQVQRDWKLFTKAYDDGAFRL
jgi:uncharacterized protein (DUF2252 family)